MPKKIPKKEEEKGVPTEINKIAEQRLIDEKLRKAAAQPPKTASKFLILIVVLLLIAGGGALAYFLLTKSSDLNPDYIPKITPPQETAGGGSALPAPPPLTPPPPAPAARQVLVLDTPTGLLNVRGGAGTNYPKIAQVSPGEIFDLVSEDEGAGWFEIKLTATTTGWITKQYARIK